MNLIEQLRTWDEMPEDDGEAFHWLDLKTGEAADNIESLHQQLAGAIAACKQKDEALSKIEYLESDNGSVLSAGGCSSVATEALAIQPDDSALKAWLGQPVARILERIGKEQYQPNFGLVARTYAELPKDSYPDTWRELDKLYSPKGLK